MKIGLVSVSFRQNTPREIAEACHACGIEAVEWGSDVHAPADSTVRLLEIAKLQSEYKIKCSSYGTYFRVGVNKTEDIYSYIKAAKLLGTRTLRIWSGNRGSADLDESAKAVLFAECKRLAEIAESESVTLCTEFHGGTYTDTAESTLELLEAVNSESFKTYWQPNQYRTFEENIACAEKVANVTENIHVFNWEGNKKYPLADAEDVWKQYMSLFSGKQYALLEFMPDDRIESLKTEAEALRMILED